MPKSLVVIFFMLCLGSCKLSNSSLDVDNRVASFSLEELQHRTFRWFWETNYPFGQVPDRYPTLRFSSIAATGFGLAAYIVGAEKNYVSRAEAGQRVLMTLDALWNFPQGPDSTGVSGYKGFFYHFLTIDKATRYKNVELSTIDTGLLMAGILAVQSYFDGDSDVENRIRTLADQLYRRVEWDWAYKEDGSLSMGWRPERGWIKARWQGYNEAMILIVLAMGSPTHAIPIEAWDNWCSTYQWMEFYEQEHVNFSPLFGHQYSHMFIDFRGIQDAYMRDKGIDYFENARRGTLSNYAYCMNNPGDFIGYGQEMWGLTACDGPPHDYQVFKGDTVEFRQYWARGASARDIRDDGTLTPTAAGGSFPFAPEICERSLKSMWENHHDNLVDSFGFKDAFNLSYSNEQHPNGWFDHDQLGIDQGPILIQIENHLTGLIWEVMKKNPYIINGLKKAGFEGGWLASL